MGHSPRVWGDAVSEVELGYEPCGEGPLCGIGDREIIEIVARIVVDRQQDSETLEEDGKLTAVPWHLIERRHAAVCGVGIRGELDLSAGRGIDHHKAPHGRLLEPEPRRVTG